MQVVKSIQWRSDGGGDCRSHDNGTPIFTLGANELGIHGPGDYITVWWCPGSTNPDIKYCKLLLDSGEYTACTWCSYVWASLVHKMH